MTDVQVLGLVLGFVGGVWLALGIVRAYHRVRILEMVREQQEREIDVPIPVRRGVYDHRGEI